MKYMYETHHNDHAHRIDFIIEERFLETTKASLKFISTQITVSPFPSVIFSTYVVSQVSQFILRYFVLQGLPFVIETLEVVPQLQKANSSETTSDKSILMRVLAGMSRPSNQS